MSFTVSGSTWSPKSVSEHADSILASINATLAPSGQRAVKALSSIVWIFCLAFGAVAAAYDAILTACKNSLIISLADDAQLMALLPITGTSRLTGSYSSLYVLFYASALGDLLVPAGTHVYVLGQACKFVTQEQYTVPMGTSLSILTICDTKGPIAVGVGEVVGVSETLANFDHVDNLYEAVPGSYDETSSELRARLIAGRTVRSNIDGLVLAIRALSGIQFASAWFNYSLTTNLTLQGGKVIPPRTAYLVVRGVSDLIAATYMECMLAPSYGTQHQDYVSLSGQYIAVNYDVAVDAQVYVRVYIDSNKTLSPGYPSMIKNSIVALSGEAQIGQSITQEFVMKPLIDFPYATINGVEVSNDGIAWGRVALIGADAMPIFNAANVTFVLE